MQSTNQEKPTETTLDASSSQPQNNNQVLFESNYV